MSDSPRLGSMGSDSIDLVRNQSSLTPLIPLIRRDFPALQQEVNGHPLVYLDNAATTQKPEAVIRALDAYYRGYNSNVHRAAHALADQATQAFEAARVKVANFIQSPQPEQLIWIRGTTEAINLVAATWGRANIRAGDRILVPVSEHHSNIVPWQMLALEKGAEVIPVPLTANADLDLDAFAQLLDERVKLVAIGHMSNALGTIHPVAEVIAKAHAIGAKVLVDGAQAMAHWPVDVQALDCDFYAFSGHKMFAPTGIGALWGKRDLLEAMPPYQGGGEMIEQVSFAGTTYNALPYKFEAGTPHIAGVIGFGAAVDYLTALDRLALAEHERAVFDYALERAREFPGFRRLGAPTNAGSILSFLLEGTHPADVGTLLDQQGVAVRTGHHCTQPLMEFFGVPGTVRASLAFYNTKDDVDMLFAALTKAQKFLI